MGAPNVYPVDEKSESETVPNRDDTLLCCRSIFSLNCVER